MSQHDAVENVPAGTESFADYSWFQLGIPLTVRFIYLAVAAGLAVAVLFIAPVVLMGAPAHADFSGYRSCVGKITEPIGEADPQNLQLIGVIEQDLNSGVTPAAEAQRVSHMGFDPQLANGIVQCVIEERP